MSRKRQHMINQFSPAVLLIVFLAIVMTVYIVVRVMGALSSGVSTTTIEMGVVNDSFSGSGWFVRDEIPVDGATSNTVKHIVSNGEKVQDSAALAIIYADTTVMESMRRLDEINQELTLLQSAYQTASTYVDTAKIDQQISAGIEQIAAQVEDGVPGNAAEQANTLRLLSLQRNLALLDSDTTEITGQIAVLEQEQQQLSSAAYGRSTTITSPVSGYFSEIVDGYESVLKPDEVMQMTAEQFTQKVSQEPTVPTGKLGKVSQGFYWYFAMTATAEQAARLSVGDSVTLQFSQIATDADATVAAINTSEDGQALIVFQSSLVNGEFVSMRRQDVEVVLASYEGLVVPTSAVTMREEDNQLGVYILTGNTARFKVIDEPLYKNEQVYVVPSTRTSNSRLVAGDAVITRATGLSDMKVVK